MSKISTERLQKIFDKGTLEEQRTALSDLKKYVADNHEKERQKHETEMQLLQLKINEINGNC